MTPTPAPRGASIPGLDAARALAVMAMVFGHTAHALLSDEARELPWVQTYWQFRALTAPLFLFVAGWAVASIVDRRRLEGLPLIRDRLGRIVLLFVVAIGLRWPGWDVPGLFTLKPEVVRHVLGFDALHCISVSLLAAVVLLSVSASFRVRVTLLAAASVAVPLMTEGVNASVPGLRVFLLETSLVSSAASPFALFPWMAYVFAGALTGIVLGRIAEQRHRALALFGVGAALVGVGVVLHAEATSMYSAPSFAFRLGQVLLLASGATLLPTAFARRLSPVGQSALVAYVLHLPVVYGWSIHLGLGPRWGHVLAPWQVLALAVALVGAGVVLAKLIRRARPPARAAASALVRSASLRLGGRRRPQQYRYPAEVLVTVEDDLHRHRQWHR